MTGKFRRLDGAPAAAEHVLLGVLTLLGAAWAAGAHHALPWAFFQEQYLGLILGVALAAIFVGVKTHPGGGDRVPWFDWLLALAALAVGLYVAVLYPVIAYQLAVLSADKLGLGALAVLLVLEATRRLVGWALVAVAVTAILYARFAWVLPGVLYGKGSSWERIVVYLYLDSAGVLGVALAVTASIVVAFVLFGQVLYAVGGDRFLTDFALVAMGRFRGGSAKVAVVSSTLFGTVSGSAVSNVAVDGAITIPMMKRTGYPPHLAAAIEAVASNGGQIMPPVMGAAAFLIAEFLSVPYGHVALAALLPALLYYLALFTQIDLEAAKHGLAGLPRAEIPTLRAVLGRGWVFLIPLGLLVYTLMIAVWAAGRAGIAAALATLIVGVLGRETRPTLAAVVRSVLDTGRILLDLVTISALAGLVIGALQLSGFTSKLPIVLTTIAGGHALGLLVLSALVCVVLGMSLPTVVVYVTLAVLVAPALAQVGIAPLAAHLFLFYFGMLSLITPPNCLATFTAAAIAGADFWKTGWTGMRLGIVAYVVPFVFVYHPALVFQGTAGEIVAALATAAAGVMLLAVGCAGYLFRPLGVARRSLVIVAGLLLIPAPTSPLWLAANVTGAAGGALVIVLERMATRLAGAAAPARAAEKTVP